MGLQINERTKEGIRILDLQGNLRIGESELLLRNTLLREAEQGHINVILNFAGVREVDDDGLAALLVCHARLRRAGGSLKLLSLSRVHMELFVFLKLEGVFEVYKDEQDAIDSFFPDRTQHTFDILKFVEEQSKRSSSDPPQKP
jgi:anti-sigma B factor antagonist